MVRPPKPTLDDALPYVMSVKEAFHDEPEKYREFVKLIKNTKHGVDAKKLVASVEKLFKGHRNLLLGFRVFLPPGVKITIPPEAEPDDNKRIRVRNFLSKLKERFQGDDGHVYELFLEIMKMYEEGNKSSNELYQEVVALLQGHEDLVVEFSDVMNRPIGPSGSNSARDI